MKIRAKNCCKKLYKKIQSNALKIILNFVSKGKLLGLFQFNKEFQINNELTLNNYRYE